MLCGDITMYNDDLEQFYSCVMVYGIRFSITREKIFELICDNLLWR